MFADPSPTRWAATCNARRSVSLSRLAAKLVRQAKEYLIQWVE